MSAEEWPMQTICPHCRYVMDAASTVGEIVQPGGGVHRVRSRPPRDGDRNVCFNCGLLSTYQTGPLGVFLRIATPAEAAEILAQHGDYVTALRAFNRARSVDPELRDRAAAYREIIAALEARDNGSVP